MTVAKPSIAVIIPVYNGADYLAETIESVLHQTLQPDEIVVIDDGSSDNTAEVAKRYSPSVSVITRPNGGVSAARNYGAWITRSEWLAFLDHDDLWEPPNLERQMATIMAAPMDADFSYCDRRICERGTDGFFRYRDSIPPPPATDLPRVLTRRCPFTPCSVLIRRDAFLGVGGFDGRHNSVEDWDLFLRLAANNARFVYTPEKLVAYRIHATNATRKGLRTLQIQLGVVNHTIAPNMTTWQKATSLQTLKSLLESDAAILMRETEEPGSFALMLRSLARHPFHSRRRYPVAAHMALTRVKRAPAILRNPARVAHSLRLFLGGGSGSQPQKRSARLP